MPVSFYSGPSITNLNSLVPAPIHIVKAFKYILNGQLYLMAMKVRLHGFAFGLVRVYCSGLSLYALSAYCACTVTSLSTL